MGTVRHYDRNGRYTGKSVHGGGGMGCGMLFVLFVALVLLVHSC